MISDVIIIGGGAAGLCAAVALKQKSPQLTVRLLESLPRVGKKLATTGNGRCNITNKNITADRYHGANSDFCNFALGKYNLDTYTEFFESIGVPFVFEGDKAFPASFQAASVVDCLRFAAEDAGVLVNTETKVTNIQIMGGHYKVIAGNMSFVSDNLIIAAGLLSGGEKLGCDGSMLTLLIKSGFTATETTPAIVQIKTVTDTVKQLKGIKVNCDVILKSGNKEIRKEYGEVLFCDYGLSGPPVLQVSREASRIKSKCQILLDLMPEKDFCDVYAQVEERAKRLNNRTYEEFFTGMFNKRVGQVILKLAGLKLSDTAKSLDDGMIRKIASIIKSMSFEVLGTTGFVNSQVTAGGLETAQFDSETMMCKSYEGLYAIGEILDIDGDCGGFNLSWAWSSALCAADSVIKRQEKRNASDK